MRSASLSTLSPLDGNDRGVRVEVPGFTPSAERDQDIRLNQVSPGFFQTFGIGLLQGRTFTEGDNENAPKVALLNETAARFYFGDRSPIGAQSVSSRGREAAPAPIKWSASSKTRATKACASRTHGWFICPCTQSLDQSGTADSGACAATTGRPT